MILEAYIVRGDVIVRYLLHSLTSSLWDCFCDGGVVRWLYDGQTRHGRVAGRPRAHGSVRYS